MGPSYFWGSDPSWPPLISHTAFLSCFCKTFIRVYNSAKIVKKNPLIFSRVMITNVLPPFSGSHWNLLTWRRSYKHGFLFTFFHSIYFHDLSIRCTFTPSLKLACSLNPSHHRLLVYPIIIIIIIITSHHITHTSHFICSKITVKAEIGKYNEQDSKAKHWQLPLEKKKKKTIKHTMKLTLWKIDNNTQIYIVP